MNNIENKQQQSNKLLKEVKLQQQANPDEVKDRQNRTLVVKRYTDKNIRNSQDVRKELKKEFPGAAVRDARTTPGGSIVVEFNDADTAKKVKTDWKENLFGGNKGVMIGNQPKTAGIVKHVITDYSEQEIKDELSQMFPRCEAEFFKRNGRFTGTIKIKFNKEEELQDTIDNCISIFEHRYIVEPFIFKPRVIKCNKCQVYGHLSRLCLNPKTVCGKCKSEEHETLECTVTRENFVCCHCDGNHQAGDKMCEVMKEKEAVLKSRFQNV